MCVLTEAIRLDKLLILTECVYGQKQTRRAADIDTVSVRTEAVILDELPILTQCVYGQKLLD